MDDCNIDKVYFFQLTQLCVLLKEEMNSSIEYLLTTELNYLNLVSLSKKELNKYQTEYYNQVENSFLTALEDYEEEINFKESILPKKYQKDIKRYINYFSNLFFEKNFSVDNFNLGIERLEEKIFNFSISLPENN